MVNGFQVLDDAKFGSFHRKLVGITGIGAFTDLYNTIVYTAAIFSILSTYHTNLAFYGYVGFVFFIGGVIGALTWGVITDLIGRRVSFILDLVIMAAFALLSGVVVNQTALVFFRFMIGFALGGDYPSALTLLSEFSPAKSRGKLLVTFWTIFAAGGFFAGLVGYFSLLQYGVSTLQMQIVLASGAIPAIIGIIVRFGIPESPRWLARKGKLDSAVKAIETATGVKVNKADIMEGLASKRGIKDSIKLFFNRKHTYITASLAIAVLLPNFIPTASASFTPYIFSLLGVPKTSSTLYLSLFFELPLMIFGIIGGILAEKIGRLKTMTIDGIIIGIAAIAMSFVLHNSLGLIIAFVVAAGTSIMYFGIAYSLAVELYPTAIRGAAEGYNTSLSRLSGALAYLMTPLLIASYGDTGLWRIYGSLALVGIVVSYLMLRRVTNVEGKSLEAITGTTEVPVLQE